MPNNEQVVEKPQEIALKRSQRERKSAISDDYMVYLREYDFDIRTDLVSFSQTIKSVDSIKWMDVMKDEMKSMDQNKVQDLIELPEGYKKVGSKWVFKTKHDSKGNIE